MRIDFKAYKQAKGFLHGGESILEAALVLVCLVSFDQSLIRHSSMPTHLRGAGPVALFSLLSLRQTTRSGKMFRTKYVVILLLFTSQFCRHNRDF